MIRAKVHCPLLCILAITCSCARPAQDTTGVPPADEPAAKTAARKESAEPGTAQAQIVRGAKVFEDNCEFCHGDKGEGGSGIHRAAPQVLGPHVLATAGGKRDFANAEALHAYISTEMPPLRPGNLEPDQYWDVAAYMASANEVEVEVVVGPENASDIFLGPGASPTSEATGDQ